MPSVIPEKEIALGNLSQIVSLAQTSVNDTAKRFHQIADQRLTLVEKRMHHSAVKIKTVDRQHPLQKIEQISISDIQQKVADVPPAAGLPANPLQRAEIRRKK